MIERQHPVVEPSGQVRHTELIESRSGDSFDRMLQPVAKQSGETALKRWQAGQSLARKRRQFSRERRKRILMFRINEPFNGIGRHERIAAAIRMSIDAVEKQKVRKSCETARGSTTGSSP